MRVGTKSLLFGFHQFLIHPAFIAAAWIKLYGVPWDVRIWIAFIVHDWGYWGKRDMDGEDGERHVETGAKIMSIFGPEWRDFCLYHSRYYARKANCSYSELCVADKMAICLYPPWLAIFLARLSGEIHEYVARAQKGKYKEENPGVTDFESWHTGMVKFLRGWIRDANLQHRY